MHQKNVIVRGGALAALMALAAGAGSVGAEELPLYLTLSQSLTRDSNLLRDNNDRRQWASLLAPGGAIRVDTTHLSIHEVVDRMLVEIRRRQASPAARGR